MAAQADSAGIPSLNSRDAETGGAVSESGCSISTLLLYQGESQNLVHTQMWCSTAVGMYVSENETSFNCIYIGR